MDKSKTLVKGTVSEFDREKLSVGQKVEVVDRKDPKKRWSGTVTQVGSLTAENTPIIMVEISNRKIPTKVSILIP